MKTVDKNINLPQAKKILKNYANKIVEMLKSKKLRITRKENSDNLCWQSSKDKEGNAYVDITLFYHKIYANANYVFVFFLVSIYHPNHRPNKTDLEAIIRKKINGKIYKKYPLTNFSIFVSAEKPKIPILEPSEEVAKQLYLALKCYDKITSKIKTAERLNSLLLMRKINKIIKLTK